MKDFEIEYNKWISTKLESLTRKYSTNSTYYHTINHINDCLECLTIPELREYDTPVMRWTIYYHDCVYNPKSTLNEEESAKYAYEDLLPLLNGLGFKKFNTLLTIQDLILATKHNKKVLTDKLEKCIVDIDLSILGAEHNKYQEYVANIRREYSHISDSDFARGRTKILQSFLDRPNIFHILTNLENSARTNIKNEILYLSGQF